MSVRIREQQRKMMKRKGFLALAGGLFAATLSLTTPAAATAAETAYNAKTQFLTAYPTDSMDGSCVQRRIELAAGNYTWRLFFADAQVTAREGMYFGAGWYTWTDCLDPRSGYYHHTSALDPDNPAWETVNASVDWQLYYSDTYGWGSYLDPHFAALNAEEEAPDVPVNPTPQAEPLGR